MKNLKDPVGNQIRDLPACSAVSEAAAVYPELCNWSIIIARNKFRTIRCPSIKDTDIRNL